MMPKTVKKPRTMNDHQPYVDAISKLDGLRSQRREKQNHIEAALMADRPGKTDQALALLDGSEVPPDAPNVAELRRQLEILDEAVRLQEQRLLAAQREASAAVVEDHRSEHDVLRAKIVEAVVELKKAFDEEAAFVDRMIADGVMGARGSFRVANFSQSARLPNSIKRLDMAKFIRDNSEAVRKAPWRLGNCTSAPRPFVG